MREFSKYFKIDNKISRIAIKKNLYQYYILISKEIPFRKPIYVFNEKTKNLIKKLNSATETLKYTHLNYYTLKKYINNGLSHNNKIYSYNEKL